MNHSMNAYELTIEGMTCGHCESRVRTALEGLEGARTVRVDHRTDRAYLTLDHGTSPAALRAAVQEAGYAVREVRQGVPPRG